MRVCKICDEPLASDAPKHVKVHAGKCRSLLKSHWAQQRKICSTCGQSHPRCSGQSEKVAALKEMTESQVVALADAIWTRVFQEWGTA